MTDLKLKKKELAKWISFKNDLPRLIDCSGIYGDEAYTEEDLLIAERKIEKLKEQIKILKNE